MYQYMKRAVFTQKSGHKKGARTAEAVLHLLFILQRINRRSGKEELIGNVHR